MKYKKLIIEACTYIEIENKPTTSAAPANVDDTDNRIFTHLKYRPDDIPGQKYRRCTNNTAAKFFAQNLALIDLPLPTHDQRTSPSPWPDFIIYYGGVQS